MKMVRMEKKARYLNFKKFTLANNFAADTYISDKLLIKWNDFCLWFVDVTNFWLQKCKTLKFIIFRKNFCQIFIRAQIGSVHLFQNGGESNRWTIFYDFSKWEIPGIIHKVKIQNFLKEKWAMVFWKVVS